jgi:hypothetical protein
MTSRAVTLSAGRSPCADSLDRRADHRAASPAAAPPRGRGFASDAAARRTRFSHATRSPSITAGL